MIPMPTPRTPLDQIAGIADLAGYEHDATSEWALCRCVDGKHSAADRGILWHPSRDFADTFRRKGQHIVRRWVFTTYTGPEVVE